ncbi:IS200/IS605 family element transposase accessory protein TnpB [Cylindrospermopsis raciborskii CS-506_B]|nr:RNA-guided endonuclease TnpB family protein [Cylindrospermopsis raciborskii]MBA4457598.1 IS200/IS605 family element transposase accessory protein TnpB [Cylindrospermopsis raciborskii CS-506_B]
MQLVKTHPIYKNDKYWQGCDLICFRAKSLYNLCTYYLRQSFFKTGKILSSGKLYSLVFSSRAYQEMAVTHRGLSVIRQVLQMWKNYIRSWQDWQANPSKYVDPPKIPNYKHKIKGRFPIVVYNVYQGCPTMDQPSLVQGMCQLFEGLFEGDVNDSIGKARKLVEAMIIPRNNGSYLLKFIYEVQEPTTRSTRVIAGIDLGVNNLVALTTNSSTIRPLLVNGKPLKSLNRLFNRKLDLIGSYQSESQPSQRLGGITTKHHNRLDNYLHQTSSIVINYLKSNGIKTLVVGKNDEWEKETRMGTSKRHNFMPIPHSRLIDILEHKCRLAQIELITVNEAYTSKCSAWDFEPIAKHQKYLGERLHRGLFRSANGQVVNADLNSSLNIIRMYSSEALTAERIGSCGVQPLKVNPLARVKQI